MRILFDKIIVANQKDTFVVVEDKYITYVGVEKPNGKFDKVVSGKNKLLMPGLYNCHTHAAMTLFRGYGEDLPLHSWLKDKIYPAEDLLTPEAVYTASQLCIAEQIKNGIVSFSDMYFFCDQTVKATQEMGMKANIGRCIVSFDENMDFSKDKRFIETDNLFKTYHNTSDGRIKIDMSLHAEYTNVFKVCEYLANYALKNNTGIQIHLSETEEEHLKCIERNGKTPAKFFYDSGVFDANTTAAHCVYVSDDDMDLMCEKRVNVVHNPVSNLKLGSGVMRLTKMLEKGLNVTFGTDSAASNNTIDILKEMYTAAILHKGIERKPDNIKAAEFINLATLNGAIAQNRVDCGKIESGYKADLIIIDLDDINNIPMYDSNYAIVYSANSSNVKMTMVDGNILYENGEYKTIDIDKLKYDMRNVCEKYWL